tara:strand:+ start:1835 stop:2473 length:639 start_codon:yes stop_codon:yes gene_type:complete
MGGTAVYWAKSVSRPNISLMALDQNKRTVPGATTFISVPKPITKNDFKFEPVEIVFVDMEDSDSDPTLKLLTMLDTAGFGKLAQGASARDFSNKLKSAVGTLRIDQIAAGADSTKDASTLPKSGTVLESWTLHYAWPMSIDFGQLSYSEDGFLEVKTSWVYSGFTYEHKGTKKTIGAAFSKAANAGGKVGGHKSMTAESGSSGAVILRGTTP